MPTIIVPESPDTADARTLIAELDAYLIPVVRKNFITPLDTILPTCEDRRRRSPVLQKDALAMMRSPHLFRHLVQFPCILLTLLGDMVRFLRLCLRPPMALAAENLFLRKQLALYQERRVKPL